MKKKLESKLAHGVRQVKSQREQEPAAPSIATPAVKPATQPAPVSVAPQRVVANSDSLHPRRVWPD